VQHTIEALFEWSGLGLLKAFGPSPSLIFSFLNNTTHGSNEGRDKVKVLVVQLLSKNSEMVFYKRSHLHPLGAKPARIGLLDVSQKSLEKDDIKPFNVKAKDGGLYVSFPLRTYIPNLLQSYN
jgi:hypothetical protein